MLFSLKSQEFEKPIGFLNNGNMLWKCIRVFSNNIKNIQQYFSLAVFEAIIIEENFLTNVSKNYNAIQGYHKDNLI